MRKKEAAGKRERDPGVEEPSQASRGGSVIVTHRRRGDEDENRRGWVGDQAGGREIEKMSIFGRDFRRDFLPFWGRKGGPDSGWGRIYLVEVSMI